MCDARALERVLSLTPTPLGNHFLKSEQLDLPEPHFPLDLYFCENCRHVQLGHVVDPRVLYQSSYSYVTATSATFLEHLRAYAAEMVARFSLGHDSLVADIGSNDGSCLKFFKRSGVRVLGIDPAMEIARRATDSGIPTVPEFFSYEVAQRLRESHGPAAFITSHNACAHIDDLAAVLRGVRHWLARDGVFVFEVGYLLDVVENLWFDTIYHEHLDYHTVAPFQHLLTRVGLRAFAAQRVSPQGGSIRMFVQRTDGSHSDDGSIKALIDLERRRKLDEPGTFIEFGRRIDEVGAQLRTLLYDLKRDRRSIAGFGAPTKATTLLCQFGLGKEELDFIVDDNPLKQGLFTPGTRIPVVDARELYGRRPNYLLLLAWNFAESIMAAHRRYAEEGGRFILPMPTPRLVV